MAYASYDQRALYAAEQLLETMGAEIERIRRINLDKDVHTLRKQLRSIQTYDENVRQIISSSSILQEAWDNFRVQYQLMASKELLETAKEKIEGSRDGICHGCKRPF